MTTTTTANQSWIRPAAGVDIEAAARAAATDMRNGLLTIIDGQMRRGALLIRRAQLRLAICIGNASIAQELLEDTAASCGPVWNVVAHEGYMPPGLHCACSSADVAALDTGAARVDASDAMRQRLAVYEQELAAMQSRD